MLNNTYSCTGFKKTMYNQHNILKRSSLIIRNFSSRSLLMSHSYTMFICLKACDKLFSSFGCWLYFKGSNSLQLIDGGTITPVFMSYGDHHNKNYDKIRNGILTNMSQLSGNDKLILHLAIGRTMFIHWCKLLLTTAIM